MKIKLLLLSLKYNNVQKPVTAKFRYEADKFLENLDFEPTLITRQLEKHKVHLERWEKCIF